MNAVHKHHTAIYGVILTNHDYIDGVRLWLWKCGHQQACCSCPRWHTSMENHGGMIQMGKTS